MVRSIRAFKTKGNRTTTMLRRLTLAALAFATVVAVALPDDAVAGGRWRRHPAWVADTALYPGWGYYSYPWGYVIPTAPYAYPVVYNCLRRYPTPRPWGLAWRETWVC
jgi:hypothetical protein